MEVEREGKREYIKGLLHVSLWGDEPRQCRRKQRFQLDGRGVLVTLRVQTGGCAWWWHPLHLPCTGDDQGMWEWLVCAILSEMEPDDRSRCFIVTFWQFLGEQGILIDFWNHLWVRFLLARVMQMAHFSARL